MNEILPNPLATAPAALTSSATTGASRAFCHGCSREIGEHEPHFWRNHEARCSICWGRLMHDENDATIRRLTERLAGRR